MCDDRYVWEHEVINTLKALTLFNPVLLLGVFVVMYNFFALDLASFSSKNLKNYIQL